MLRQMLKSKIHRATVTYCDLEYEGSLTLDPVLMAAAGLLVNERIDVYNVTNGERFSTYVIRGEADTGAVGINGAAARRASTGDIVIIAGYGLLDEEEARTHRPRVVHVDLRNRITRVDSPVPPSNAIAAEPAEDASGLA